MAPFSTFGHVVLSPTRTGRGNGDVDRHVDDDESSRASKHRLIHGFSSASSELRRGSLIRPVLESETGFGNKGIYLTVSYGFASLRISNLLLDENIPCLPDST